MIEDNPEIEQLHSAINNILGGFCTKWILVADITDDTGENNIHTAHASGMAIWDALGLIRFAERFTELQIEPPYDNED